jgi:hypothetical protein
MQKCVEMAQTGKNNDHNIDPKLCFSRKLHNFLLKKCAEMAETGKNNDHNIDPKHCFSRKLHTFFCPKNKKMCRNLQKC